MGPLSVALARGRLRRGKKHPVTLQAALFLDCRLQARQFPRAKWAFDPGFPRSIWEFGVFLPGTLRKFLGHQKTSPAHSDPGSGNEFSWGGRTLSIGVREMRQKELNFLALKWGEIEYREFFSAAQSAALPFGCEKTLAGTNGVLMERPGFPKPTPPCFPAGNSLCPAGKDRPTPQATLGTGMEKGGLA